MPAPLHVEIYSRPECHLCDEAKDVVERVRNRYAFSLRVINVDDDPGLAAAYGTEIPVIFINGSKAFKYRVDEADFEKRIERLWKP